MAAALAAVALLAGCGPDGAPAQHAASSRPALTMAAQHAAVTPLPVAAAPARVAPLPPPSAPMTVAQMLHDDPALAARERALHELYENAHDRDPTGEVERDQQRALSQRRACTDKDCLQHWFNQREAALKTYVQG